MQVSDLFERTNGTNETMNPFPTYLIPHGAKRKVLIKHEKSLPLLALSTVKLVRNLELFPKFVNAYRIRRLH